MNEMLPSVLFVEFVHKGLRTGAQQFSGNDCVEWETNQREFPTYHEVIRSTMDSKSPKPSFRIRVNTNT